jgi:hypothetical protein
MNDVSVQLSHRTWLQGSIKGVMVSYSYGAKGSMQMGQNISDICYCLQKKRGYSKSLNPVNFGGDGSTSAGCTLYEEKHSKDLAGGGWTLF